MNQTSASLILKLKLWLNLIIMFGCYTIVEIAVQVISLDLLVCSKCSLYLENDINDK